MRERCASRARRPRESEASLQYSLGLPVTAGRVAVPAQWLRDWAVQAQITLELLAPEGPQRKETCRDHP